MMRLVTTTALALALTAPGYAVLAQETKTDAKAEAGAKTGVYIAKAEKGDVFGTDFIGKDIYVKEAKSADAGMAADEKEEVAEAKSEGAEEVADAKQEASEEVADAKDESAEEMAEAKKEGSEEVADAKQEASEEVAEAKQERAEEMAEANEPEWDSIGEVSDVIMTRDGDVKAVLVDVGGFLGLGAKTVAITMEELAWQTEEGDDEPFLVLKTDRAALENAPEFQRNPDADEDMRRTDAATTGTMAATTPPAAELKGEAKEMKAEAKDEMSEARAETKAAMNDAAQGAEELKNDAAQAAETAGDKIENAAEATGEAIDEAATETAQAVDEATDEMAAEVDEAQTEVKQETAAAPAGDAGRLTKMDAAGYQQVEADVLTAESVEGATVYDMGNDDIGEVVDLVLSADGKVEEAIIDVGGFLGLGEHRVAVSMGDLKFMRADADADDVRVYVASTKEELEAMPEVDIDG
ncbi:PRC-barrel domain-containing protein [Albimonas sp. CAU 1670]|uniref:PRC-barrel domain-containing protein n=1 Tax=Albimonas sp. CAU 1670 TaxID=3032599 RepID=UPI0023DC965E|nr:PRC-barrel domain-containing protein [Albimonas sp. CAU 1670]MDF2231663.1 PRC-barrel domain-containing protein [Albimonas sp. CAU 1670]